MKYNVLKCEAKNKDWKVVTLQMGTDDGSGEVSVQEDVSVNRTNKKGEVFPDFDAIAVGNEVAGELWSSPAGKWYLFAPKVPLQRPKFVGGGSAAITKAQETKREDIKDAQERKHDAIARAGAMRDATLVTIASLKDQPFPTNQEFKDEWISWVKFFLGKADEPFI